MTFLAPALLAGTVLAGVPVVIHLLNRRRVKRIQWAAMEFLLEAARRTRRRLKIEDLLLMLLRAAIVALLAAALSRPLLFSGGGPAGGEAVILVDRSASMGYSEGAGTLFDFGRSRATEILNGLGEGGTAVLVLFDSRAEYPLGWMPTADFDAIRVTLGDSAPGWCGTDYSRAIEAAARASKGFASKRPPVFLVSDFRAGTSGAIAAADALVGPLFLVPVTGEDGENTGVAAARPAGTPFTAGGSGLRIRVSNDSARRRAASLSVSVDSGPSLVTPVVVPSGDSFEAIVTDDALEREGTHVVEARIAGDALGADDRAWGVVVRRPLRVALSARGEARTFLSAALSAAPDGAFEVVETTPEGADGFDAVILASDLSTDAASVLRTRVTEGLVAVVFLDAGNFDTTRALIAGRDAEEGGSPPVLQAGRAAFHLALAADHPVTAFVRGNPDLSLASVAVGRMMDASPASRGFPQGEVLLTAQTPDATMPFLTFHSVGKGGVAVVSASANREAGDFVVSPFFVPLLYETLAWFSPDLSARYNVACGEEAWVEAPGGQTATVAGPRAEFPSRLLSRDGRFLNVFTPDEPGIYGISGETFAANVPPAESVARSLHGRELERLLGGRVLASTADVTASARRAASGTPLAATLLAVVAAFLAVEMVFVWLAGRGA